VALPEGSLVVNSSQGGGSRDTWVLADGDRRAEPEPVLAAAKPSHVPVHTTPSHAPDTDSLLLDADQQQQQSRQECEASC
jgi:hypothetical protein